MERTCEFFREYAPQPENPDLIVRHLQNCPDCQEQTRVVAPVEASWGFVLNTKR